MKLKGGALYYAVALTVVIGLLAASVILFGYQHRQTLLPHQSTISNNRYLNSAIALLQSSHSTEFGSPQNILLFDDDEHSLVELQTVHWGWFQIGISSTRAGRKIYSKIAMFGSNDNYLELPALYLRDDGKPLSLCGETKIEGSAYLPKAGVKRAYIEGKNYLGSSLIYGFQKQAQTKLPVVSETFTAKHQEIMDWKFEGPVKVYDFFETPSELNPKMVRSFSDSTLVLVSETTVNLKSDQIIKGNVIIASKGAVFIESKAIVDQILVYAPSVVVSKGFEGSIQIFATDSIILENDVQLQYPSSITLLKSRQAKMSPFIQLKNGSEVWGLVSCLIDNGKKSTLQIEKNARVIGQCYNSGTTEISGAILGSLWTGGFYLKTPSAIYENHLLDVTISNRNIPDFWVSGFLFEEENKGIVQWLR